MIVAKKLCCSHLIHYNDPAAVHHRVQSVGDRDHGAVDERLSVKIFGFLTKIQK